MASGEKVNWRIPSNEWDLFCDYVHDKYGDTSGYMTREVEAAMREWVNEDDYAGIEEKLDRLVRAAGRIPNAFSENKISRSTFTGNGDTTKVQTRVHTDVKAEFRAVANQTDDRVGIQLAKALRARREGGRSKRLEEKLDRIADDAEGLLSELNDDMDDPNAGLSLREKRTITICKRLNKQFTRDDLHDAIGAVAGDSAPTLRDYEPLVLDWKEVVQHPNNPDIFIQESRAEELNTSDAPAVERKDYDDLTREEKVRGIQVELAREAKNNRGYSEIIAQAIKQDIFDSRSSEGHTYDLMRQASNADGFHTTEKSGIERLRVDLSQVTDSDILEAAGIDESGLGPDVGEQSAGRVAATDGGIDTDR